MVFPATFTHRASRRRRLPPQSLQLARPLKRLSINLNWIL